VGVFTVIIIEAGAAIVQWFR